MIDSINSNTWECPNCKEVNEIAFDACWKCLQERHENEKSIIENNNSEKEKVEFQTMEDEQSPKIKRPILITIICIILSIGLIGAIRNIFSEEARMIADWYLIFMGLSTLVTGICIVGLWNMEKWAVYTFTCLFVFSQIVNLLTGIWDVLHLAPLIVIIIGIVYFNKME